ncbi:hypothetical protein OOZ63_26505 [Paucibacter sp. PLA-PC-4]|uniref:hypothetical protein n=1 Tax=Paucibacter sp. PLA-PC-4 TaxID=2993655 RepID=UPI00224B1A7C|nr:hypothetical protein [Paucibacter sp. PLA-PC-4]MCX2865382.1 hypothetical protein [Paucibacter sp. PLA-PC-4]
MASRITPPTQRPYVPIGGGVEKDSDIAAALVWLATSYGDAAAFFARLSVAQQRYREVTANDATRGKDPSWSDLGPDIVAAYLAQGKSLLDDRRSYDFALVSHVAPWLKQLGVNLPALTRVVGAPDRALRMLRNSQVLPDTALFELVMASNYAAEGFDVAFIAEGPGKTPDLRLSRGESGSELFVELKRLQRGDYEIEERRRHAEIFHQLEPLLHQQSLSVDVDVTYERELADVPVDYLLQRVKRALASPFLLTGGYPWKDELGSGLIRDANVAAVRRDTRESYLYFGTKMARLLSGRVVSENNYHLAAQATANPEDPRYVDQMRFGSVVTWQCIATKAIERKAKYVRSKLAEADKQIAGHGRGIVHIAMDAELHNEASDLRRQRNQDTLRTFQMNSKTIIVYLHYLVPRVSEDHSWLTDETVDVFSRLEHPPPPFPAFPRSTTLDNDEPAWRQRFRPSNA